MSNENVSENARRVLVVDDEPYIRKAIKRMLKPEGLYLFEVETGEQALSTLDANLIDVVLLDVRLPDINGIDVLKHVKNIDPEIVVIIMTGHGTVQMAVEAMKEGAFEFLTKPFESPELIPITVRRALQYKALQEENRKLEGMVSNQQKLSNLVGVSAPMQRILQLIPRLADIDSTVLITGESGTGKEVLARAIHFSGNRRNKPFVPVDCGAIPAGIIESELFGHTKGAFTGAGKDSEGLIKQADQGTIFLDEIGELPLEMQTRLLRFLQEREIRPLGGAGPQKVDARVIAATNQNLAEMIEEKTFREDLYYRINVIKIEMPPLRERKDDIPLLINHFMKKHAGSGKSSLSLSPETFDKLMEYRWPGNIRELENIIIQVMSLATSDKIGLENLPQSIRTFTPRHIAQVAENIPLSLEAYEKLAIERALQHCEGNIVKAARLLGVGKSTLYRKIKGLDIESGH